MKPRLFIDMDGVLADFDKGYEANFGVTLSTRQGQEERDRQIKWELIRNRTGFFRHLPLMPGALQLWRFAARNKAYVLTGCPDRYGSNIALEKRQWVRVMLGGNAPVICCPSSEKALYCHPGDVIVDDWPKYQGRWEAAGGKWITHIDTTQSIEALRELGYE